MKIAGYQYQSCFGSYIEQFVHEKKEAGFLYESEEWLLKHFDAFCYQKGISEPLLGKELVAEWGTLKDNEEMATCSKRISVVRQLGLYMISLGWKPTFQTDSIKRPKR